MCWRSNSPWLMLQQDGQCHNQLPNLKIVVKLQKSGRFSPPYVGIVISDIAIFTGH